jgi:hypothetical protein
MTYAVNFWGSKPHTNDDCHTGTDFETREAAMEAFNADPSAVIPWLKSADVAWVELDGPGIRRERRNPAHVVTPDDFAADLAEAAMQAGMAFGTAGYNDAMGY